MDPKPALQLSHGIVGVLGAFDGRGGQLVQRPLYFLAFFFDLQFYAGRTTLSRVKRSHAA